ncbi:SpoIVB peptidase, partial [Anaerospora hongkongensis]
GLPPHMRVIEGETALFTVNFPLTVTVDDGKNEAVRLQSPLSAFSLSRPVSLESVNRGKATVDFKLLGLIPVRTVEVDVLPSLKIVPGGHSIGVVLHSQGVIVVGISPVLSTNDQYVTPAKDGGIVVGDVMLSINGNPVQSDAQVAELIDESGRNKQPIDVLIKRGDNRLHVSLTPVLCKDTKRYRIGLYVRDSAAGVGTLTFFEPQSQNYGALGHVITDSDTNQPIDCNQGKIVLATVSGIQHGKRGQPGEKIGVFIEESQLLGDIKKNTPFGIYGNLNTPIENNLYPEALPVASMSQIQTGEAEILTVVDGQTIEKFSIEIQKVNYQEAPEGKGLVIKVTDPRLLDKTGGIVQGMSGSPIIQNGRVIGAVTHVFVHDPTRGYGTFIDWMLMESGLIPPKNKQTAYKLFSYQKQAELLIS